MGVVDILQTDINHVGGITALWKAARDGRRLRHLDGAARLRRPDRRHSPPSTSMPRLPNFLVQEICSGVEPEDEGKDLGGMARLPRHAHGQRPLSACPTSPASASTSRSALKKYPFGGTRPMARVFHEDGSVAEWKAPSCKLR